MGRACRRELPGADAKWPDQIELDQHEIAKITEMIHTASLVHDDVIDEATSRRGKLSVNVAFTPKECVLGGDAILAKATHMLANIGDVRVIEIFAQVIEDLVRGELMQLGLAQEPEQRFNDYIKKSEAKVKQAPSSLVSLNSESSVQFNIWMPIKFLTIRLGAAQLHT